MNQKTEPVEIGSIIKIEKGKPPKEQPYFGPGAELYLTPEYLRGGASAEMVKAGEKAIRIEDGDTIVLWDGSNAGEFFAGRNGVLPSTMCRLKINNSFEKEYFYYALKMRETFLKSQTSGSGIPHVDKEILGKIKIIKFPNSEQAKIAEIISTADRAIEKTDALIAKQQRIKTGLMQDLLTRGIDEHGNIRSEQTHQFKDSPLGRIPAEWRIGSILDFTTKERQPILTGPFGVQLGAGDFVEEGVPVLRIGNVQAGFIDMTDLNYVTAIKAKEMSRWLIRENDLLFARQGATTGRNALAEKCCEGCLINYHIIRVSIDSKRCDSIFLHSIFNSSHIQRQVDQEKGRGTREGVSTSTLLSFILPVPSFNEQVRIGKVLNEFNIRGSVNKKEQRKLKFLEEALMQDLLTSNKRTLSLLGTESKLA